MRQDRQWLQAALLGAGASGAARSRGSSSQGEHANGDDFVGAPLWQTLLAAGGGTGALELLARCPGVARVAAEAAAAWGGDTHVLSALFPHEKMKAAGLGTRTGESMLQSLTGNPVGDSARAAPAVSLPLSLIHI